jgi:hypothetical protein
MCLECGYYNGKQVMDIESLKAKRDARIKAKKERINIDSQTPGEVVTETKEATSEKK